MRKRMSPIASSARSKRRMRPKRRKKPPVKLIWKREGIRNEGGRGGREWGEGLGKRVDLGRFVGVFLEEGERTYRLCRTLRRFLEGEG